MQTFEHLPDLVKRQINYIKIGFIVLLGALLFIGVSIARIETFEEYVLNVELDLMSFCSYAIESYKDGSVEAFSESTGKGLVTKDGPIITIKRLSLVKANPFGGCNVYAYDETGLRGFRLKTSSAKNKFKREITEFSEFPIKSRKVSL